MTVKKIIITSEQQKILDSLEDDSWTNAKKENCKESTLKALTKKNMLSSRLNKNTIEYSKRSIR